MLAKVLEVVLPLDVRVRHVGGNCILAYLIVTKAVQPLIERVLAIDPCLFVVFHLFVLPDWAIMWHGLPTRAEIGGSTYAALFGWVVLI